jgi:alpha-N-acetylglucosaminidase
VQIFKDYGLDLEDQYDFYSGPAFLPWYRMGNMRGFGGPLTMDLFYSSKRSILSLLIGLKVYFLTDCACLQKLDC